MSLTFEYLMGLIEDWKCDCKYTGWKAEDLKVYITKSSGKIVLGLMDENQNIVEKYSWEQKL